MIILTITDSTKQLVSGIPEFVTVESSVPATIFYTLDGTGPTSDSEMYVDKLYLTYDTPTVLLKLKAIGISSESDIVEMSWGTTTPDYSKVYLVDQGINILPSGKAPVDSLAVGLDGYSARETAIEFVELEMKTSTSDRIGQEIPDGSTLPFVKFPKYISEGRAIRSSTSDFNFDPQADVILIDGLDLAGQQTRIVNRPHGTIDPTSKQYKAKFQYDSQPTGDFSRYMYDPKSKKLVMYYRESRDGRWIVSTQQVDAKSFNLTPNSGRNRLVFKWVEDRYLTRLF